MNEQNQTIEPPTVAITDAVKTGATGLFDKIKTPVFWLAAGYAACWFMNRKKSNG